MTQIRQGGEALAWQRLDSALNRLGLGKTSTAELVTEGLMNLSWAVTTSGNERVFIKQVLDVDADQARLQHRATAALSERGLPVCTPFAADDGSTLIEHDGALFAIYPWVNGSHIRGVQMTAAQAGALGSVLGRMHLILAEVMPAARQARTMPVADPAKAFRDIGVYRDQIGQRGVRSSFDEFAADQLNRRHWLLERVQDQRPEAEAAWEPCGWGHGDFHDLNVLWDGGELAAVLDFDRLGERPFAFELVRSATLTFGHGDERGLDLGLVTAFVCGYREEVPLGAAAIVQAVRGLWWERVCDLWQLKRHYVADDASCDHLFVSASALLWWWTGHRADVERAVLDRNAAPLARPPCQAATRPGALRHVSGRP